HEAGETLPQLVDDLLLAGLAGPEVDGRLAGLDPELLGPGHGPEHGRRLQELLGRYAAPVQTGPPHLVLLHHGHRQPGGGAVEGGRVASGPPADDHHIELAGRADHLLSTPNSLVTLPTSPDGLYRRWWRRTTGARSRRRRSEVRRPRRPLPRHHPPARPSPAPGSAQLGPPSPS